MKKWQVVAVLALLISVNVIGFAAQKASNDLHNIGQVSSAGSEGWDIHNVPLNPINGLYYQYEIHSMDGRPFSILFTNETELHNANLNRSYTYAVERSAINVTSASFEGQLPDGATVYELIIISADPDAIVQYSISGHQGTYSLNLRPVFQVTALICQVSSIILLILLIHTYTAYRSERRQGL